MNTNPAFGPILVIEDHDGEARPAGELLVAREGKKISLPLSKIDVSARVVWGMAGVTVSQTFRNPYPEPLEAVYIFPLGGGSVVRSFVLRAGGRELHGDVRERLAARAAYSRALGEGRRAALLEKERDDVFTVTLGNLPPGETATVEISYSELLDARSDGTEELRLPLVVAPRYIPGEPVDGDGTGHGVEPDTDLVPDASRITPPRLATGVDPSLEVGVAVEIEAGSISDLACTQHATRTSLLQGVVRIELARSDERANRDFVLRWRREPGSGLGARCIVHQVEGDSVFGMLSLDAPATPTAQTAPRDIVFVLDRSGSMGDVKMASASRACSLLLEGLGPDDRFAILAFDTEVEWYEGARGARFVAADEAGRRAGAAHLRSIESRGGTEMNSALAEAFSAIGSRGESSRDAVIVLITDGEIGDESRVMAAAKRKLGATRLFTVGIDTAVNDGFLRRIAGLGRGTATFVEPGAALDRALQAIGREIGRPAVLDLRVTADAGEQLELATNPVPDLFFGRRLSVFFRAKSVPRTLRISGKLTDGGEYCVDVEPEMVAFDAIPHLWARERIAELEDLFRIGDGVDGEVGDLRDEIVSISTAHRILSRFTAFVVVDGEEIVNLEGSLRTVVQPVEMPAMCFRPQLALDADTGSLASSFVPESVSPPGAMHLDSVTPGRGRKKGGGQSHLASLMSSRRERSIKRLLDELHDLLALLAEVLEDGDKQLTSQLSATLREFEARMDSSNVKHRRIVETVGRLLEVIDADEDPREAFVEAMEAVNAMLRFWESSI